MLKVTDENQVKMFWHREIDSQKQEGLRQIEELKRSHQQALLDKQEAIEKEKHWLDGEDWDAEVEAMRLKMRQTASDAALHIDHMLQHRLQTSASNKQERFHMKQSQSLNQVLIWCCHAVQRFSF
jgi:hypothetical protein